MTKLLNVATMERAISGKVYKKGTTIVQISATRGQTLLLKEDQEIPSKYVAFYPTNEYECIPEFLFTAIEYEMERFCAIYQSGLNIVPENFKFMEINLLPIEKQREVVQRVRMFDDMSRATEKTIELLKDYKKQKLQVMFPSHV